jgi:hypothetical protein
MVEEPKGENVCEKINDDTNKYIGFLKFLLCWNEKWNNMNIIREKLFPK